MRNEFAHLQAFRTILPGLFEGLYSFLRQTLPVFLHLSHTRISFSRTREGKLG